MIARATLAWMLAGPVLMSASAVGHGNAAAAPLVRKTLPQAAQGSRDRWSLTSLRRGRAQIANRANRRDATPAIEANLDDDLAYDTPRDAAGRTVTDHATRGAATQVGVASWYGGPEWQGRTMTNGCRYEQDKLTAAHASLPLGTLVRVSLADDSRSVVVRITDRPGTRRRVIDLSRAAAVQLGMLTIGVARVRIEPL